jgi:photosystem II stability/assembly factor-like uncharacterized protein
MVLKYLTLVLAVACSGAAAAPAAVADPMARPAQMVSQPAKAYLAGIARAGKRLVAVGERGIIVLSDDGGTSWRQAKVPASVTLAAVQFPTPTQGWAVGHYGIVLHSGDGGETWTRQLDGVQAAQLVLRDAQLSTSQAGQGNGAYLAEAQRLVADGPDKPFLGLHFSDAKNGLVVGAYNLAFRTQDGGNSWTPLSSRIDNPKASHLYAVQASGNDIYIAGEQGLLLRSTDAGQHFARVDLPYKGSLFAMALAGGDVVVAGLGGNAFRSGDQGASWHKLEVPVPVSITAVSAQGGKFLMTNQAGMLLAGAAGAAAVAPLKVPPLPPLNDVLAQPDGAIVAVGMTGAIRLPAQSGATPVSMAVK